MESEAIDANEICESKDQAFEVRRQIERVTKYGTDIPLNVDRQQLQEYGLKQRLNK